MMGPCEVGVQTAILVRVLIPTLVTVTTSHQCSEYYPCVATEGGGAEVKARSHASVGPPSPFHVCVVVPLR